MTNAQPLAHSQQPSAFARPVAGSVACAQKAEAQLGEGLLWSQREQALYWVDILQCQLHRLDPASGEKRCWTFAEEISAVAERAHHPGLIVTLRRGFAWFDPAADIAPRYVYQPAQEPVGNRFNDGKCDAQGRFWAGSMDFDCVQPTGSLYRYDADGQCSLHESGFAVTNGPTWSGRFMYFNDTVQGCVYRYAFDPVRGELSGKQAWLRLPPGDGVPDGMTTDALGRVWLAHWGGGCVTCHDPDTAQELARVAVPAAQVTNCAFGGDDFRTLFISSARVGLTPHALEAQPLAGSVFAVRVDSPGLPASLFGG